MTAFLKIANYRPCYSPSPWGEGRDEDELTTDLVGPRCCASAVPAGLSKIARRSSAGSSRLLKLLRTELPNYYSSPGFIKLNQGKSSTFKPPPGGGPPQNTPFSHDIRPQKKSQHIGWSNLMSIQELKPLKISRK
jgi:hypothetical protein